MARTFEPMQLGSIELFCKAAELGSFAAAAEALGVTPAAVSRSIGRLEARLGVQLFVRTTRRISLTPAGVLYHTECREALEQIAEAERAIAGHQRLPTGTLRISAPTTYAHFRLIPLIARFGATHPGIEIELDISNRNIDFVSDGFDIVIRRGEPPDSQLIGRHLEEVALGVYAAPAYLARHGRPERIADLEHHECIQFILPSDGRPVPWQLRDADGRDCDLNVGSRFRVRGDLLGCVNLALAGSGLFQMYAFLAREAVARGELVEVLTAAAGRSQPFFLLYPHNRHLSTRVRTFVEFVVEALAAPGSGAR